MWCTEGLECVVDVTQHEQKQMWAALTDKESPGGINLNALVLRARYNSQRHYEIYTVSAVSGITADDIKEMFEASPQYAADLIRERGHKVYSDRADKKSTVIT